MSDTRQQILHSAARLAQSLGFSAFSYADIAAEIGIRKASIHHHFASKEALELALVEDYRAQFANALLEIDHTSAQSKACLRAYAKLYQRTLDANQLCLCGMMASDLMALPESVRIPLKGFFSDQITWLSKILQRGKKLNEIQFEGSATRKAQTLLACLQGALMVARVSNETQLITHIMDEQLMSMRP